MAGRVALAAAALQLPERGGLARQRTELSKFTGALCTAEGIYTGWIPGYLLVTNMMPGAGS